MLRPIITIDEEKCNGCGQCILDCAEGALAIVDGKARLVSDVYCDGLGACLNCPQNALRLEMREAAPFDEQAALRAKAERQEGGCPGSKPQNLLLREIRPIGQEPCACSETPQPGGDLAARLPSWPIQLGLLTPAASFLQNAHILLAAHCAGFALTGLHDGLMVGRIPVIACPKLEANSMLTGRLAAILAGCDLTSITVLRMSVPCCGGLERIAQAAMEKAGVRVPYTSHVVSLR